MFEISGTSLGADVGSKIFRALPTRSKISGLKFPVSNFPAVYFKHCCHLHIALSHKGFAIGAYSIRSLGAKFIWIVLPPSPDGKLGRSKKQSIGSEIRMKISGGEECVLKFLGSKEGFHRECLFDDSSSEYAPLIG